jgi:hypothetical protein
MKKFLKKIIHKNSYLSCLLRRYRYKKSQKIPSEELIKEIFQKNLGYTLNLKNPQFYNEKIQWLKLYGENNPVFGDYELAKKLADKVEVREYISKTIGEKYLKKIYGIYENFGEIDFSSFPDEFVIKASHDSGSVIIVRNKDNIPKEKIDKLRCNLKINFGLAQREWVYKYIKPKIIVEELIKDSSGQLPVDYKVFCFQGEPKLIQVDFDRFTKHRRDFYDLKWNKLDLEILYQRTDFKIEKPSVLQEMLELSEILSKPFNHARVDWFCINNKLYFGEVTFFPESGFGKFNTKKWEKKMGEWIKI